MERSAAVEAIFEPVSRPSMFEETVERLGTAIRVGLLPPGTQLPPERELADQLGISRSTLRHALTTPVQSGLLASARGRGGGTFVAARPPLIAGAAGERDVCDVVDDRLATETGAVVLAAERRRADDVATLTELVDFMATAE